MRCAVRAYEGRKDTGAERMMKDLKKENGYEDILYLPHPTSQKHPRMSMADRAAQFSPFAALTGYDAAVKEAARLTDQRIELDEYEKAALDRQFQKIVKHREENQEITVTFFRPDEKKVGGAYVSVNSAIRKFDEYGKMLIMQDGSKIPIDDIIELAEGLR